MHTIRQVLNFKTVSSPSFHITFCILFVVNVACSNDDDPVSNNGVPTIININPTEGRPGETISVRGSNFAIFAQANLFFFNGAPAQVYVGIPEELLVRVPLEASTGPVSVLVPGFDTVRGPVFTVERIESVSRTMLYYAGETEISQSSFDQEGNVTTELLFSDNEMGLSLGALEVDIIEQKIYVLDAQSGQPAIYRLNIDGTEFETLYDTMDPAFTFSSPDGPEPQGLRRITLDLEDRQLYVTDVAGRILRGSMDGSQPLEILYDDGQGFNTIPFGINLAIGDDFIYWTEADDRRILRMRRDGSDVPETLYDEADGLLLPVEIVIDEVRNRIIVADDPFLQDGQNIDRLLVGSLDGNSNLETLLESDPDIVSNPQFGLALDVTNNLLYWGGRPFSGSDNLVVVRADLSQEDPSPDIIVDDGDTPSFTHFTIVVTQAGGSNGRLRARVGG